MEVGSLWALAKQFPVCCESTAAQPHSTALAIVACKIEGDFSGCRHRLARCFPSNIVNTWRPLRLERRAPQLYSILGALPDALHSCYAHSHPWFVLYIYIRVSLRPLWIEMASHHTHIYQLLGQSSSVHSFFHSFSLYPSRQASCRQHRILAS